MKLKIEAIGDLTGVILPEDLVARLNLRRAQWVEATELPDRGLRLAPHRPASEDTVPAAGEKSDE